MMRVLVGHLSKEWREQRSFLLVLLGCIPVLLGACALGFPAAWRTYDNVVFLGAYGASLLCALVLGGRLVADEIRSGGIRFLDRLPQGLWPSFVAKALLLLCGLVLATLCGLLAGGAIRSLAFGDHQHWGFLLIGRYWVNLLLFVGPAFGLMAIAAWMPRSGMALPGLFVLYLLLVAPVWAVYWLLPELALTPPVLLTGVAHLAVGSIVAAAVSYVRGWRRTGREQRALSLGAVVLVLFMAPVWGSAGFKALSVLSLDPRAPTSILFGAFLGADGHTLYVNGYRRPDDEVNRGSLPHTLRIDLRDGSFQPDGGRGSLYANVGALDRSSGASGDVGQPVFLTRRIHGESGHDLIDTRSGRIAGHVVNAQQARAWIKRLRPVKRATTPYRLWDGRRAWFLGGRLEVENGDGWSNWMDLGRLRVAHGPRGPVQVQGDGAHLIDMTRKRLTPRSMSTSPGIHAMLRAGWLVPTITRTTRLKLRRDGRILGDAPWQLEDPESGRLRPAAGLGDGDHVVATLDGDRVLVLGGPRETRRLFVVEPETGTRSPVDAGENPVGAVLQGGEISTPAWSPGGRCLFRVKLGERHHLARLEPDPWRLVLTTGVGDCRSGWPVSLIACTDEDHALVIAQQRRIELWTFGSDERKVLFPRR